MAPLVGGKGGGKPDLAQAGGKDAAAIEPALAAGRRQGPGKACRTGVLSHRL